MSITLLGIVLIPLGAILFVRGRKKLLYLTVFFAPFTASAVVNIDGVTLGVQPAYCLGILYVGRFFFDVSIAKDSYRVSRLRLGSIAPFWLFTTVSFLSIFAIPLSDRVLVRLPSNEYELLKFRLQNLTQFAYLLFMTAFVTCLSFEDLNGNEVSKIVKILIASAAFACFWGWVEAGSILFGYPYPAFLFNNSVSFAQQFGASLGGFNIPRISSIAPEPSMFARFLLAPTFITLYDYYHKNLYFRPSKALGLLILFTTTIFAATSSTGYVGLVVGLILIYIGIQSEDERGWLHPVALGRAVKVLAAGIGLLTFMATVVIITANQMLGLNLSEMGSLLELLVLNKLQTGSGQERLGAAARALELLRQHPIFGVGWGSNRTFDLVTNVFTTTGILGGGLFFFFHYRIGRKAAALGRELYTRAGLREGLKLRSLVLGLSVLMVGKIISEPDIVYMDHWVFIGLLVALRARLENRAFESKAKIS